LLFADDSSIIVTNSNQAGLHTALNKTFYNNISRLKANFLPLNFNKTYYLEIRTKNFTDDTLDNKPIANVKHTEILGLVIHDS
jgi:hypothetical protein